VPATNPGTVWGDVIALLHGLLRPDEIRAASRSGEQAAGAASDAGFGALVR
jgi:hypothetical protein